MKILHVVPEVSLNGSGPEFSVLRLVKYLNRAGVQAVIYASHPDSPDFIFDELSQFNGVPVKLSRRSRSAKLFNYRWSYPLYQSLRKDIGLYDLVHIHSLFLFSTLAAARIAREHRIPYIMRPHGSLTRDGLGMGRAALKKLYIRLIERHNIEGAHAIHFTTGVERDSTPGCGFRINKAVVVPNAIDPDEFSDPPPKSAFRERYPVLKNKKVVLFLGRIAYEKGFDTLIPAFARVAAQDLRAHMVIAGPDHYGYLSVLQDLIRKGQMESRILFAGRLDGREKLEALCSADVFVLPSYGAENFGAAAVEAMVCGVPVVVTDRVGIHRDVEVARAGLATPKEPAALAEGILRLLQDENLRRNMGMNARKLVEENYTGPKVAQEMIGVYRDVLRK